MRPNATLIQNGKWAVLALPPTSLKETALSEKISEILNDLADADNVQSAETVLKRAENLDYAEQAQFVSALRDYFSNETKVESDTGSFTLISVEPLNSADLKQGYRIVYKDPKPV